MTARSKVQPFRAVSPHKTRPSIPEALKCSYKQRKQYAVSVYMVIFTDINVMY